MLTIKELEDMLESMWASVPVLFAEGQHGDANALTGFAERITAERDRLLSCRAYETKLRRYGCNPFHDPYDDMSMAMELDDEEGNWVEFEDAVEYIQTARQEWPVGSMMWAHGSNRRLRRIDWKTPAWFTIKRKDSGEYWAMRDGVEFFGISVEDATARDFELEPEGEP